MFVNNVLGALVGYAAMFFIIRYMGKEALGIVAFSISFVGLFSFLTNLGFDNTHIKKISDEKNQGKCNGTYIGIKLSLIAIFVFAVITSIYVWKDLMGNGFESRMHEQAVYLSIIYWSLFSILYIFVSTFNGKRQIARSQTLIFINNFTRSLLTIIIAVLSLGVLALVNAYIAGVLVAIVVAIYLFRKMPVKRPDMRYLKSYVKFALPLAISSSAVIIAANTDVVMIQWFWSALDVADYYAAKRIGMLMTTIGIAIGTTVYPAMSRLHSRGDIQEIRKIACLAERYLSMVVFPLMFFILVFTDKIVVIMLSESMRSAIPVIRVLTVFYTLTVMNIPYAYQLPAMNRTDISGKIGVMRAVINIGLNFIFIPTSLLGIGLLGMGAVGAAMATLITFLITTFNMRLAAYRLTGSISDKKILIHISSAILTSVVFLLIDTSWASRWYTLGILGLAFMGVYLAILALLKEFKKEDFELFFDAFNPKKMLRYMGGELKEK